MLTKDENARLRTLLTLAVVAATEDVDAVVDIYMRGGSVTDPDAPPSKFGPAMRAVISYVEEIS